MLQSPESGLASAGPVSTGELETSQIGRTRANFLPKLLGKLQPRAPSDAPSEKWEVRVQTSSTFIAQKPDLSAVVRQSAISNWRGRAQPARSKLVTKSLDRTLRSQLTVSVLLLWLGIVLSVYGSKPLGGPIALLGMLWLGACIHRLGRSGL